MKQGWEIKKLGDVAKFSQGIQVGLEKHETTPRDGYVRFIRIVDYTQDTEDVRYVPNPGEKYFVNDDDIVMVRYGTPGLIGRGKVGVIANNLFKIKIEDKDLTNDYLVHYLSQDYIQSYLSSQGSATMPALNFEQLKTVEIKFPPLPEQQRIVAILDEAFAAIAKAKANAEQNLKNAKELFESYLQSVFENPQTDWEEKKLGEVCSLITKGSSPKWQGIKYVEEPGILFVTSENVGEGELILEQRKYVEEKFNQKDKKSILQKGDVLTNIVGASIGRTAIYTIDDVANINQAVCILRCKLELISNTYLMNLLNSPFLKEILHSNEVNTARANLSLGFFNNLSIPLPPLAEQQAIVRKVDALRTKTRKIESIYQQKINDLEELKKSILQKAFSGELRTSKEVAS